MRYVAELEAKSVPPREVRSEASLIRLIFLIAALCGWTLQSLATEAIEVRIGYLHWSEIKPTISIAQLPTENDGVAGAQLALHDNNTTGKFLNQRFALEVVPLRAGDDPTVAARLLADRHVALVIADVPAD